jgi:hypothetical protein
MSALRNRLGTLEERRAFREYLERKSDFERRSREELEFFATHGFWPEGAGVELPTRREFVVNGIRTVVTTERA